MACIPMCIASLHFSVASFYWVAKIMYTLFRFKFTALTVATLLGAVACTSHPSANNAKSTNNEINKKMLMQATIIDFDGNNIPDFVSASKNSTLSLSP
ncbi:hypothetical protein LMK73_004246, partial [Salmonella enterica]|nr:hypothetical protein [Salmonella enterica]